LLTYREISKIYPFDSKEKTPLKNSRETNKGFRRRGKKDRDDLDMIKTSIVLKTSVFSTKKFFESI